MRGVRKTRIYIKTERRENTEREAAVGVNNMVTGKIILTVVWKNVKKMGSRERQPEIMHRRRNRWQRVLQSPNIKSGAAVCFRPLNIWVTVQHIPKHRCNVPIKNWLHTILGK